MNVMLLAAGAGTRLRPYTLVRPKPAMPFLNVPLASFPLGFLEDLKIDRLVVNTFHLPTQIVDLFVHLNHGARKLYFSHEIHEILGSGGGLGFAREYFSSSENLIMMNADEVILPLESGLMAKAIEQHNHNNPICTLLTMEHEGVGTQFGGVWLDNNNKVCGFGKTPPHEKALKAEHFIGVQILSGKIFDYLPEKAPANILYDAVTAAIHDGHRVERFNIHCHWYETGNPEDFLKAQKECLKILAEKTASYPQTYLRRLLERFSGEVPRVETFEGEGLTLKSTSSLIEKNVHLSGYNTLGPGCLIHAGARLENVVVGKRVQIAGGTQALNQIFLESP